MLKEMGAVYRALMYMPKLPSHLAALAHLTKLDLHHHTNLHIHSVCSDGQMNPLDIVEQAAELKQKMISITDHNTTESYAQIVHIYPTMQSGIVSPKDTKYPILLTGVEFDTWYKGHFMHILGYGIDIQHPKILSLCAKTSWGKSVDIVRIWSFQRTAHRVITSIQEAGGIAVLAHPCCILAWNFERLLCDLLAIGLGGIEVYYPYTKHRRFLKFRQVCCIEKLAQKYDLWITGGTDCHRKKLNCLATEIALADRRNSL